MVLKISSCVTGRNYLKVDSDSIFHALESGDELKETLTKLKGIERVDDIGKYEICLKKGELFEFNRELAERIAHAISEFSGSTIEKLIIEDEFFKSDMGRDLYEEIEM